MMRDPLHIPLVLDGIVAHLQRRHLFKAMRVSRTWHDVFQPIAWKCYTFNRQDAEALARNGRFVEQMNTFKLNEYDIEVIASCCPNVKELKLEPDGLPLGALECIVQRLLHLQTLDITTSASGVEQLVFAPLAQVSGLRDFRLKGQYHYLSLSPVSRIHANMLLNILHASAATLRTIKLECIQPCFTPIAPEDIQYLQKRRPVNNGKPGWSEGMRSWWSQTADSSQSPQKRQQKNINGSAADKWEIVIPMPNSDPSLPPRIIDIDTYWKEFDIMRRKEPWRNFLPSLPPKFTDKTQAEIDRITAPLGEDGLLWQQLESIYLVGIREHVLETARFLQPLIQKAPHLTSLRLESCVVDLSDLKGTDCPNLRLLYVVALVDSVMGGVFSFLHRAPASLRELHFVRQYVDRDHMWSIPAAVCNQLTALTIKVTSRFTLSELWAMLAQGFTGLRSLNIEEPGWPTPGDIVSGPWMCASQLEVLGIVDIYSSSLPPDSAGFLSMWSGMKELKHLRLGLDQARYFHLWLAGDDLQRPLELINTKYDLQEDEGESRPNGQNNNINSNNEKPRIFEKVECLELGYTIRTPPLMLQEVKRIVCALPKLKTIRYWSNMPTSAAAWNWLKLERPDLKLLHKTQSYY